MHCLVLGLVLVGCGDDRAQDNETLVVYASADEPVARLIVDAFEKESGIDVTLRLDSEASKTVGLAERLRAQRAHPEADVFWSSECFVMDALAVEGILTPLPATVVESWPRKLVSADDRWAGFAGRVRVVVWNPQKIEETLVPTSLEGCSSREKNVTLAIADVRFGTTRGHFSALAALMSDESWSNWCQQLAQSNPMLLPGGNAAVVDAVASGEAMVGLTDSDDAIAAQAQGRSIAWRPIGLGLDAECGPHSVFVIPNTVGIIVGARHPDSAAEFAQFLLSSRGESILAQSASANVPLGSDAKNGAVTLGDSICLVDVRTVASAMTRAIETFLARVRDAAGER